MPLTTSAKIRRSLESQYRDNFRSERFELLHGTKSCRLTESAKTLANRPITRAEIQELWLDQTINSIADEVNEEGMDPAEAVLRSMGIIPKDTPPLTINVPLSQRRVYPPTPVTESGEPHRRVNASFEWMSREGQDIPGPGL